MLIFGAAALAARADRVRVDVASGATVADVLRALGEQHAPLKFALDSARLAVNHAFAGPDTRVSASDELALISLLGG